MSSIPTLIIQNVGIPIGMSFGLTEDASIYNEFFFHFHNVYGFEISDFVDFVESDQGKALISAAHRQGMSHICCLRHLLVSLGKKKYSSQVGTLVTATTDDEYQKLKALYSESWSGVEDPTEKGKITRLLKKIGHEFKNGSIQLVNENRWIQVSIQYRSFYRMPSCTN